MQSVLLVLDELNKLDDSRSVICPTGYLERVSRLDRLPRAGDRTRFIVRDTKAEAVYRVAWRRSGLGPQSVVSLAMVRSSGTPGDVEQLLVKAGFRPVVTADGSYFRPEAAQRLLQIAREYRGQRVRLAVEQAENPSTALA